MIKEFCRQGDNWDKVNFDTETVEAPLSCTARSSFSKNEISLLDHKIFYALGETFTLARDKEYKGVTVMYNKIAIYISEQNAATFKALYETRKQDLNKQISLLEKSHCNTLNTPTNIY
jgi:hypothetical protein